MTNSRALKVVGQSQPRVDGAEKVTGKAVYTVDVELPGMVHGKILRSPLPHARIGKIDVQRAARLPGVVAVLTREDLSGLGFFGATYKDQSVVAIDKVRYAGDPVAAVAAEDESTAAEALELIEVDYEELPSVTTIEEALAANAPLVHET